MLERVLAKIEELETSHAQRHKTLVERIELLGKDVRDAREVADKAHETALIAKHAAGKASIDSEGGDAGILAELSSLKVVLSEHADKLKERDAERDAQRKEQNKIDARARRFWRLATPAIIGLVLAILNRLTFMLAPPGTMAVEPPVKITITDAGR